LSATLGSIVVAVLLPSAPMGAETRTWSVSGNLQVAELTDGVWVHISWGTLSDGTRFPSNGLIVRDGEELVLVDTAWGVEATEELLDWTETALGLPVTKAVITHFHDDRLGGSPILASRGIPFYSLPLTRRLAVDDEVPLPEALPDLKVGESFAVGALEVFYPGPGHAPDNLVIWVADARVIFGGCSVRAAQTSSLGNTADADLAHWPQAIRNIQTRYPTAVYVVPGHGIVGDRSLLAHTLSLFDERQP
jgi:glyoxylase-like metal-dependent hydrolase (beta-lactamase superfamily II)